VLGGYKLSPFWKGRISLLFFNRIAIRYNQVKAKKFVAHINIFVEWQTYIYL